MTDIYRLLDEFREFIQNDDELKRDINKISNHHKFWNHLKTDIMVRRPDEVREFLELIDTQTRLADLPQGSRVGIRLASRFPQDGNMSELRLLQQSLIMACLELDTKIKLKSVKADIVNENKKSKIAKRLAIW
jgi:hypothetical protein